MTSLTKYPHPANQKNFFQVQTRRLAASFDTATRSIALTKREKFPCKATCVSVFFFENPQKRPDAQVLIIYTDIHIEMLFSFVDSYHLIFYFKER